MDEDIEYARSAVQAKDERRVAAVVAVGSSEADEMPRVKCLRKLLLLGCHTLHLHNLETECLLQSKMPKAALWFYDSYL